MKSLKHEMAWMYALYFIIYIDYTLLDGFQSLMHLPFITTLHTYSSPMCRAKCQILLSHSRTHLSANPK